MKALNGKKAEIIKHLNGIKGGKDLKHKHGAKGRILKDEEGNDIILSEAVAGFDDEARGVKDAMWDAMEGIVEA